MKIPIPSLGLPARLRLHLGAILPIVLGLRPAGADTVVFATDFDGSLPSEFDAPGASLQAVQNWSGLGEGSRVFGGTFLRHADPASKEIALDLTGLPPHEAISIEVLVALIDSWDFEHFQVVVDDVVVFDEWFDLAVTSTSSYVPPVGALLAAGNNLGFSSGYYYDDDRAYDLSVDERLTSIPHSGDTVSIVFRVNDQAAGHWQGGSDESWAIEALSVSVAAGASAVDGESWGRMKARYRE